MRTPAMGAGRRSAALAATALGLLATTLVTPSPSQASFDETEVFVSSDVYGDRTDESGPCQVTGEVTDTTRNPAVNRTTSTGFDDSLTVTHPADAADTQRFDLHARASGGVVATGGRPSSARLTARLWGSGTFAKGSDTACDSTAEAAAGIATFFEVQRPTLATLTVRTAGDIGGIYALDGPDGIVSGTVDGIPGTTRSTSLLSPGFYQLTGDFDLGLNSPITGTEPASATGTASLHAGFVVAGAATGPSRGAGGSYVALPDARRCGPRTLTASLRSGVGRFERLVFLVDGRRRAVVTGPRAGRDVVLRGLAPTRGATVRVVLDPARGRSSTVTRRYAACSA